MREKRRRPKEKIQSSNITLIEGETLDIRECNLHHIEVRENYTIGKILLHLHPHRSVGLFAYVLDF